MKPKKCKNCEYLSRSYLINEEKKFRIVTRTKRTAWLYVCENPKFAQYAISKDSKPLIHNVINICKKTNKSRRENDKNITYN